MATWVIPAMAFVAIVSWYLFWSDRSPLAAARGTRAFDRRQFLSYMGAEYVSSVLSSVGTLATGAYVLTILGAAKAAPLLTAASFMIVIEGALASFAQALSVEASRADGASERRHSLIWISALFLGGLSLAAILVGVLFGEQVMGLLGAHYRSSGGAALGILMFAVPFRSICLVSNADNRIRGQGGRNLLQQAVACAVCFALLLSGHFHSIAAIAWVMVFMRVAAAAVATVQLSQGRLQLHHSVATS
jgi:O-antigen/teichoic acid export membrane protein